MAIPVSGLWLVRQGRVVLNDPRDRGGQSWARLVVLNLKKLTEVPI